MKNIELLKSIKKERELLNKKEKEALSPILSDISHIRTICDWYWALGGKDVNELVFIVMYLYNPGFIIGKIRRNKVRSTLSSILKKKGSQISYISSNVTNYYTLYREFREHVQYFYAEILFRIEERNLK